MNRLSWPPIIERAREIALAAAEEIGVEIAIGLRQLLYLLLAEGLLPNTKHAYQYLSSLTAEGRRDGTFPELLDDRPRITVAPAWPSVPDALDWLARVYRRDRTEGQAHQLWLITEKGALAPQMEAWFYETGHRLVSTGGVLHQATADQINRAIRQDGRPAIALIATDFDPTGDFIPEDFARRTGPWRAFERVALTPEQIEALNLPESIAPERVGRDSRARRFVERYGRIRQVELEAIPSATLRALFEEAIDRYHDSDLSEIVLIDEDRECEVIRAFAEAAS